MTFSVEGGSQRFTRERIGISGGEGNARYAVSLTRVDLTKPEFFSNTDFENTTFSAGIQLVPTERTRIDLTVRQSDDEAGLATSYFGAFTDPNDSTTRDSLLTGVVVRQSITDKWEAQVRFTRYDQEQRFIRRIDATNAVAETTDLAIERLLMGIQSSLTLESEGRKLRTILTLGFEFEREAERDAGTRDLVSGQYIPGVENTRSNRGFLAHSRLEYRDSTHVDLGVRYQANGQYGESTNFRFALSQRLGRSGARVTASFGTGIKEPDFIETTDTPFSDGNPDLNPEENIALDVGISQRIASLRTSLTATVFHNHFSQFIQFVPTDPFNQPDGLPDYVNAGKAGTLGLELEVTSQPHPKVGLRAALTVMDTDVTDDGGNPVVTFRKGAPLIGRPEHIFALAINLKPLDAVAIQATLYRVGERDDRDFSTFPTARLVSDPYTRVDLSASWRVFKNLRLIGRVQNLFDEDYQEVFGFQSNGIMGFAGIECRYSF